MKSVTCRLDADLLAEAKHYKINISEACRTGIRREIEKRKAIAELFDE